MGIKMFMKMKATAKRVLCILFLVALFMGLYSWQLSTDTDRVYAADGQGKIEVTIKMVNFSFYTNYRNEQYPTFRGFPWLYQSYYGDGAASLKNSSGQIVDSFSGEYQHTFENLPAGDYELVLDVLEDERICLVRGVHNGSPRSDIIVWSDDKLHITIPEGSSKTIQRWVLIEPKAFGFKTTTDVGTFRTNPQESAIPGSPSEDSREYIYYAAREGGNNWDYENPFEDSREYIPYVHSHLGIFYGDSASDYRGMTALQVPTLSEREQAVGYRFIGWKLAGDTSGKVYDEKEALGHPVTDHVVFEAVWKRPNVTIEFEPNGGDGEMAPVTVPKGSDYTLPACEFTPPTGKVFAGWDKGNAGTIINVMEDTVLTAQWKDSPEPTEPTHTAEPTEPTEPTGPTNPNHTARPTEQTHTAGPTEQIHTTEPTNPDNPTDPSSQTNPTSPENSSDPTAHNGSNDPKHGGTRTGDSVPIPMLLALMALSIIAVAAIERRKKLR